MRRMGLMSLLKAAVCVAIVAIVGPMSGCVDDWVKVDVPREVQKGLSVPSRVPLSQSRAIAEEWKEMQLEAASAAAAKEKVQREEAARTLATVRTEIEDEIATRQVADAAFARSAARKLTELDAREGARAAQASADLERLARTIEATSKTFDARIAAATAQADNFGGVLGGFVAAGTEAAKSSGIPGLALLTLIGGLFIRKPGDKAKMDDAEQARLLAEQKAAELQNQLTALFNEMKTELAKEWKHGFNVGAVVDREAVKKTVMDPASAVESVTG